MRSSDQRARLMADLRQAADRTNCPEFYRQLIDWLEELDASIDQNTRGIDALAALGAEIDGKVNDLRGVAAALQTDVAAIKAKVENLGVPTNPSEPSGSTTRDQVKADIAKHKRAADGQYTLLSRLVQMAPDTPFAENAGPVVKKLELEVARLKELEAKIASVPDTELAGIQREIDKTRTDNLAEYNRVRGIGQTRLPSGR
jgi:hypothetical protein